MSMFKVLPLAALAGAGVLGTKAMKKSTEAIESVGVAATLNVEMAGIADAVAMAYTEEERLPLHNFSEFLRANLREAKGGNKRDRAKDPWDTEYRLVQVGTGFDIRSAGPDKAWETKDDLTRFYDLSGIGSVPLGGGGASGASRATSRSPSARAAHAERQAGPPADRQSPEETAQKVLDFHKRMAASGSPAYQLKMAERFLTGDGVERDLDQARHWLQKSADGGNEEAAAKLKVIHRAAE
jgi:hypothetical protein